MTLLILAGDPVNPLSPFLRRAQFSAVGTQLLRPPFIHHSLLLIETRFNGHHNISQLSDNFRIFLKSIPIEIGQ
jgi:hypothetical protein